MSSVRDGQLEDPMLHAVFFVRKNMPQGVFERESLFHTKTDCVLPNIKLVTKALISGRNDQLLIVIGLHEKVPVAEKLVKKV